MKTSIFNESILLFFALWGIALCGEEDTAKLPRIYLAGHEEMIMPGGMRMDPNGTMTSYSSVTIKKNFYKMEGLDEPIRVNYLASNLALDIQSVPAAYRSIKAYQACRIATPLLMVVGAITIIASISYGINHQTQNELGEYNEMNMSGVFAGIGIAVVSWIPYLASMDGVKRAVDKYNGDPRVKE